MIFQNDFFELFVNKLVIHSKLTDAATYCNSDRNSGFWICTISNPKNTDN